MAAMSSCIMHNLLPPRNLQVRQPYSCASCSDLSEGWVQAERERRRILARLREAREARTGPHRPQWFDFNPEVFFSMLMSNHNHLYTRALNVGPDDFAMRYTSIRPSK